MKGSSSLKETMILRIKVFNLLFIKFNFINPSLNLVFLQTVGFLFFKKENIIIIILRKKIWRIGKTRIN